MSRETLFLDIDTQCDFVLPEGAASTPPAYALVPNLERLTRTARTNQLTVIATVQAHTADDPVFANLPEGQRPWCVRGTPGQAKVSATKPKPGIVLENRAWTADDLEKATKSQREIVLETTGPDLLTHAAAEPLLKGARQVYLYGLFLDDAVFKAARELRRLGIATALVEDATAPRNADPEHLERIRMEMAALGVERLTTMQVMSRYALVKRH